MLFCSALMRIKKTYSPFQLASSVFMMVALLWLTISLPVVYSCQQDLAKYNHVADVNSPIQTSDEEAANPFGNSTEEKTPNGGSSFSEEYLHNHHNTDYFFIVASQLHSHFDADTYLAYHGELDVPPPDVA
ncbi:MAG: hypothetical protein ACXWCZ_02455 [Flavisolibacter sp.]